MSRVSWAAIQWVWASGFAFAMLEEEIKR